MDYVEELESLEKKGEFLKDQGEFNQALKSFYNGALLAKKLETSAPSPSMAKAWSSWYENFKNNVYRLKALQKQNNTGSKFSVNHQNKNPTSSIYIDMSTNIQATKPSSEAKSYIEEFNKELTDNLTEEEKDFVVLIPSKKSFKDIIGLEKAKKDLKNLQMFFEHPEYFNQLDVQPVKGILLFGPPGCGKTFLVECTCGEFGVNLVTASAADLKGKYVGESENKAKYMFSSAYKAAPCLLFVDEIDKILPAKRDESSATKGLLQVFLVEMIKDHPEFITILATNYPQDVENAIIMNKKRVNNIIYVGPPNYQARKKIFHINLQNVNLDSGISLNELTDLLADVTKENQTGSCFSASNCTELCEKLKRNLIEKWFEEQDSMLPLTMGEIKSAISLIKPDISQQQIDSYENFVKEWANI